MNVDFKVRVRFNALGAVDLAGNTWKNNGVTFADGRFGTTKSAYLASEKTYFSSSTPIVLGQDFTFCFFNKYSSAANEFAVIIAYDAYTAIQISDYNAKNRLTIRLTGTIINSAAPVYTDNKWHHYAITRQAGDLYFFVDGILRDTIYSQKGKFTLPYGAYIGSWAYESRNKVEHLDDICVIDNKALWTSDFTPPSGYLFEDQKIYLKNNKAWGMNNGILTKLSDNYSVLTDTEKESLFITTNYETALADDLSNLGKFKTLVYSSENSNQSCTVVAAPNNQLVLPKGLISLDSFEGIDKVALTTNVSQNAKCKILITTDKKTYQAYDAATQAWQTVDHTNLADVEKLGIDAAQLLNIPRTAWDAFTKGKAGIGFAYLLSMEDTTDTCSIDKLELLVEKKGEWNKVDLE